MRALSFVNKFGYGIQRVQTLLAQGGTPPAEFQVDDRVFRVIVRRRAGAAAPRGPG